MEAVMSRVPRVASVLLCATLCVALAERADGQPITRIEAVVTIPDLLLIRDNSVTLVRIHENGFLNFDPITELNDTPPAVPVGISLFEGLQFVMESGDGSTVDGLTTYSATGNFRQQLSDDIGLGLLEIKQVSVSAARPNVVVLSGTVIFGPSYNQTFDFSPFRAGGTFSLSIPLPENVSALEMLTYTGTACPLPLGCSKLTHSVGASMVQEAVGPAADPGPGCAYAFSGGSGASAVRFCVTQQGTIAELSGAGGQEHLSVGQVWEGYVICKGAVAHAWDLGLTQGGFGPAMLLSPPTSTSVSIRRSSAQFRLDQVFKLDKAQKTVLITSSLTNISGAAQPDVRLTRAYDPDVDGNPLDYETLSARTVWAWDVDAVSLTGITWALRTDTAIGSNTAPGCSPQDMAHPILTGDAYLASVTYRLGNMAAGTKRTVVHVYRMQ